MDILTKVIKTFFGTKSDKDRKEIQPYVDRILALYPQIDALSNDDLRARSAALRRDIAETIRPDEERIAELKGILEQPETSLEEKERHSREIDRLTKEIDEKIERKLDEILPEAFAIMKATAHRFAQNPTVEVTATQFDRDLAARKDFVTIEVTRPSTPTVGRPEAIPSPGTWCITTYSFSAASCSTRGASPRWRPARVRRWWPRFRYSSMPWPERACMW